MGELQASQLLSDTREAVTKFVYCSTQKKNRWLLRTEVGQNTVENREDTMEDVNQNGLR